MQQETPVISQLPHESRMGQPSTPFEVKLSDGQFQAFLDNLPSGSKRYYKEFCDQPNTVRIVMPTEYADTFELTEPRQTLEEMLAHSRHLQAQTQASALESLLRAIA